MRTMTLAMLVVASLAQAHAQTLAERELTQREDAKLAGALADTNGHCGTAMQATIDWPAFLANKDKLAFATGDCEAALQGLFLMCGRPTAKPVVAQKVKRLACVHAAGKQSLALADDGTLTLGIDLDGANYSTFVQGWLGDHL